MNIETLSRWNISKKTEEEGLLISEMIELVTDFADTHRCNLECYRCEGGLESVNSHSDTFYTNEREFFKDIEKVNYAARMLKQLKDHLRVT